MFVDGIKHHTYRSAIIPLSLQINNTSMDLIEAVQTLAEKHSGNQGMRDHIAALNQQSGRQHQGGGRFNNSGRGGCFNQGRGGGGGRGCGHASRSNNGRSGTWILPKVFRSMSAQDQQGWIEFRSQQRRSSSNNVTSGGENSTSRGNETSGRGTQSRVNAALSSNVNSVRVARIQCYHLKNRDRSVIC